MDEFQHENLAASSGSIVVPLLLNFVAIINVGSNSKVGDTCRRKGHLRDLQIGTLPLVSERRRDEPSVPPSSYVYSVYILSLE